MGFLSCFGGACGRPLVPDDHTELSRDELKRLYEESLELNNGRLIVHGIFARANTKNNNKRVYPKYILKREVTKYEIEHIKKGTALGELDHPNYSSRYFKCLNLPNISHQVLEVHWKGDLLWGTIEILPTPSGLLLWELYSQGIKLGVSSRGWASLRSDPAAKCVYVDEDFELITFDFVTEPSTKGAFLVPVVRHYPDRLPPQRHATQLAHLGMGVVSMRNIPFIPPVRTLVARINQLQEAYQQGQLTQPPQQGQQLPHSLDQLLLFSHYLVFPQLPYLDREEHARDFQSHLAMFATRAHLADQTHLMSRADLNAIILKEIAKEEAAAGVGVVASVVPTTTAAQGDNMQGPVVAGEQATGRLTAAPAAVAAQQQAVSHRCQELASAPSHMSQEPMVLLPPAEPMQLPGCTDDGGAWSAQPHVSTSLPQDLPLQPATSTEHRHSRLLAATPVRTSQGDSVGHQQLQPPEPAVQGGNDGLLCGSGSGRPSGMGTCHRGSGSGRLVMRLSGMKATSSSDSLQHQPVTATTSQQPGVSAAHHQGWQEPQVMLNDQLPNLPPINCALAAAAVNPSSHFMQQGPVAVVSSYSPPAQSAQEAEVAAEFQRIKATLACFGGKLWSQRAEYLGDLGLQLPFDDVSEPQVCPLQPKGTQRKPPRQ